MERFFSYTSNASRRNEDAGITLLSGPPCCGKTSLLFQFAVNRAAESGRGVVFICSKGRLESNPPFLSQGVDSSMSLLQRIQIKYIGDGDEIRKYFAAFHLLDNFPAAVIVDDFADFFSERSCQQRYGTARARDLAMVRALALCHNAIAHANAKLGTLGSCNLVLSDVQQGDTPRSLFIYKRWIDSRYTIQGKHVGYFVLGTQVNMPNYLSNSLHKIADLLLKMPDDLFFYFIKLTAQDPTFLRILAVQKVKPRKRGKLNTRSRYNILFLKRSAIKNTPFFYYTSLPKNVEKLLRQLENKDHSSQQLV